MSLPPAERKTSLDVAQLNLLAKKRKLEAERSFLSDQLTQVTLSDRCGEGQVARFLRSVAVEAVDDVAHALE